MAYAPVVRDCASGTNGSAKLGGNKPRGSTGGSPRFGGRNDMHLVRAICGVICTARLLPWAGACPVPVQMCEVRADPIPEKMCESFLKMLQG